MHLGETTVGRFASELSQKSGLKVTAEKYLLEHLLTVEISGVSAEDAINALAELNNWRVIKKSDEEILITHKSFKSSDSLAEVPKLLRQAIPKSWFLFLGEGIVPENVFSENDMARLKRAQDGLTEGHTEEDRKEASNEIASIKTSLIKLNNRNKTSIHNNFSPINRLLFPNVPPALLKNQSYPYKKWTSEEKKGALTLILLDLLSVIVEDPSTGDLVRGEIKDYMLHPEITSLRMGKGVFFIEERSADGTKRRYGIGVGFMK